MEHTNLHPPLPGEEVSVQTVHPSVLGAADSGTPGRRAFHISPRHPWHDGVLLMTPAIPGPSSLPLPTLPSLDTLAQPRRISRALRDTRPPTLAAAAESSCAHDCGSPAFQWSPAPFCPALLPPRGKPLNTRNLG